MKTILRITEARPIGFDSDFDFVYSGEDRYVVSEVEVPNPLSAAEIADIKKSHPDLIVENHEVPDGYAIPEVLVAFPSIDFQFPVIIRNSERPQPLR